MRWYRANDIYRFDQPIGKQYTFGHGPESTSEDDKRERQLSHLKMEIEYLNYYNEERIQERLGYLTPVKYGVMAA